MDSSNFKDRLSEHFPSLNEQDKNSIAERVGLEIENRAVNIEVFAEFQKTREKLNLFERKAVGLGADKLNGPKCSFCYKYLSEVGFGIKTSTEHVICDSCIDMIREILNEST